MNQIKVTSSIIFLLINSFFNFVVGQASQSIKQYNVTTIDTSKISSEKDTKFFDIDPNLKEAFIEFDESPQFPGGKKALINYILENTNYPSSAIKDSITGRVNLIFIVDIDGSTTNIKIIKSLQPDIDNECIRVIKEMPKWESGSTVLRAKKGLYRKIVPVYYNIPFNFVLNNKNESGITIKPRIY